MLIRDDIRAEIERGRCKYAVGDGSLEFRVVPQQRIHIRLILVIYLWEVEPNDAFKTISHRLVAKSELPTVLIPEHTAYRGIVKKLLYHLLVIFRMF